MCVLLTPLQIFDQEGKGSLNAEELSDLMGALLGIPQHSTGALYAEASSLGLLTEGEPLSFLDRSGHFYSRLKPKRLPVCFQKTCCECWQPIPPMGDCWATSCSPRRRALRTLQQPMGRLWTTTDSPTSSTGPCTTGRSLNECLDYRWSYQMITDLYFYTFYDGHSGIFGCNFMSSVTCTNVKMPKENPRFPLSDSEGLNVYCCVFIF